MSAGTHHVIRHIAVSCRRSPFCRVVQGIFSAVEVIIETVVVNYKNVNGIAQFVFVDSGSSLMCTNIQNMPW